MDAAPRTLLVGGDQYSAAGTTPPGAPSGPRATGDERPVPLPVGPLSRLRDAAALDACVQELSGSPGVAPLAVDFAAYQGAPALVVLLPSSVPGRVDVFVVGPRCSAGDADLRLYVNAAR